MGHDITSIKMPGILQVRHTGAIRGGIIAFPLIEFLKVYFLMIMAVYRARCAGKVASSTEIANTPDPEETVTARDLRIRGSGVISSALQARSGQLAAFRYPFAGLTSGSLYRYRFFFF